MTAYSNARRLRASRASASLAGLYLAQAVSAQTLPSVTVTTTPETATGPVQGYRAKRSATATKTDTPLNETPQSISVITREFIEDQGAANLQDAMRYTAGVFSNAYGFDNRGDWAKIRGADFVQYQDGLRMLFSSYNNIRPDTWSLERVEVLKGPASVLYGQGGFGGTVNLVSKRPQAEAHKQIELSLGSHNRKQIAVDLTGPLNADGTLLYRLIALGRDSGSQVDHVPDDRSLLNPAITWAPNARTVGRALDRRGGRAARPCALGHRRRRRLAAGCPRHHRPHRRGLFAPLGLHGMRRTVMANLRYAF